VSTPAEEPSREIGWPAPPPSRGTELGWPGDLDRPAAGGDPTQAMPTA
jgi:hypothetical protein